VELLVAAVEVLVPQAQMEQAATEGLVECE